MVLSQLSYTNIRTSDKISLVHHLSNHPFWKVSSVFHFLRENIVSGFAAYRLILILVLPILAAEWVAKLVRGTEAGPAVTSLAGRRYRGNLFLVTRASRNLHHQCLVLQTGGGRGAAALCHRCLWAALQRRRRRAGVSVRDSPVVARQPTEQEPGAQCSEQHLLWRQQGNKHHQLRLLSRIAALLPADWVKQCIRWQAGQFISFVSLYICFYPNFLGKRIGRTWPAVNAK